MRKKIIKYNGGKIKVDDERMSRYKELKLELAKIMQELDPLEEQIKDDLKVYMTSVNKKSLKLSGLNISYRPAYTRTMFDSKGLKEVDMETYNKYSYQQIMSSSVSIRLDM